jgi:AraC-like DNA-binding protein
MFSQREMVRSFRFSTGDLPPRARGGALRELHERGLVPVEPLPDRVVHVEIAKWLLPRAGVLSGTFGGVRQDGSSRAETSDDLFYAINLAGPGTVLQRGRAITPKDGDAVLVNPAAGAFAVVRPTPARFVGLRVPRRAIAPLVVDLDDRALCPIPRTTPGLRLLTGYLRGILGAPVLASPEAAGVVVTHLYDLIALSVGTTRDAAVAMEDRGVRAARLRAIKADIVDNLEDDALTVPAIAARHRITPRYVHKLFESDGTTYTQFVLGQRLERAHRILRDPRWAARSIGSIAYDLGFGDLSYFNRTFRRRYDATPSDVRHRGGGTGAGESRPGEGRGAGAWRRRLDSPPSS